MTLVFKIGKTQRIIHVRELIWKTCVDGLPQLGNLLKGDMSTVCSILLYRMRWNRMAAMRVSGDVSGIELLF